jgi:hypothetical protein
VIEVVDVVSQKKVRGWVASTVYVSSMALWLGGQRLRATFHRLAQLESHHVVGGERAKEQILLHE